MSTRTSRFLAGGLAAALILGALSGRDTPAQEAKTTAAAQVPAADQEAIRAVSRDYSTAFNKGDAKAVAVLWTEQGECHDADGEPIRGRAAIEKAFAEFFKENPTARIEVLIESIRFPAPDLAIEEGMLRQVRRRQGPADHDALQRDSRPRRRPVADGRVPRVGSRAGPPRRPRLARRPVEGHAQGPRGDADVRPGREQAVPHGRVHEDRPKGKAVASGTMRIGLDPQTGQLRSWHFDDDGGHGQALWLRDGNRWVLDSVGVLADGDGDRCRQHPRPAQQRRDHLAVHRPGDGRPGIAGHGAGQTESHPGGQVSRGGVMSALSRTL